MVLIPLLSAWLACSGDGPEDPPTGGETGAPSETGAPTTDPTPPLYDECDDDASVELGTGQTAFEPLPDDADLLFYLGPQGGHHVFVSLRSHQVFGGENALDPLNPVLTLRLSTPEMLVAEMIGQPRQLVGDLDNAELVGQLLVFSVLDPPALDGEPATLEWTLVDRCERTFSGATPVVLTLSTE